MDVSNYLNINKGTEFSIFIIIAFLCSYYFAPFDWNQVVPNSSGRWTCSTQFPLLFQIEFFRQLIYSGDGGHRNARMTGRQFLINTHKEGDYNFIRYNNYQSLYYSRPIDRVHEVGGRTCPTPRILYIFHKIFLSLTFQCLRFVQCAPSRPIWCAEPLTVLLPFSVPFEVICRHLSCHILRGGGEESG